MRSIFAVGWLMVAALVLTAGTARAASESVEIGFEASPVKGTLFKEVSRPVEAHLDVAVKVPGTEPLVTPMIFSKVTFPADMSFHPDPKSTPVCPPEKIGPQTNLGIGVARMVDLCPGSVVGTGTAVINLAGAKAAPLPDPQLVVFNAGRTTGGYPKITIYGFSKMAGAGLIMTGTLDKQNGLGIAIGVLPFDSSIDNFRLGIPGPPMEVEDASSPGGIKVVRGQDPNYLRAKCSTGTWTATGDFVFATRDVSTGALTSPETPVKSPQFDRPCEGRAGKAAWIRPVVKGPRTFQPGGKRSYKVTVRNTGTASARKARVKVSGGGRGSVQIRRVGPSRSVTAKVRVKFPNSGKPRRTLKIKVVSPGTSPVAKVSVRRVR